MSEPRLRAADDFAAIRARIEELKRERKPAPVATLGECWLCQRDKIPCNGACYGC